MDLEIREILAAVWPLLALQFFIMIWALVDLIRRKSVKHLPKIGWVIIIVLINLFGPIAYLVFGRGEE